VRSYATPRAVLWGYFIFMAIQAFPGNQFIHRVTLFVMDISSLRKGETQPAYVVGVCTGMCTGTRPMQLQRYTAAAQLQSSIKSGPYVERRSAS
jgi:hypothetical protein